MDAEFKSIETEMNRGFIQVLILVALEQRMYGYGMIRRLAELGYSLEENTLYPLLRRLEKNHWIKSEWDVRDDRPRRFYAITKKGREVREQALQIWTQQSTILKKMTEVKRHACKPR